MAADAGETVAMPASLLVSGIRTRLARHQRAAEPPGFEWLTVASRSWGAKMLSMGLMLQKGEKISIKGRTITVTDTAFGCLPKVRDRLIEAATARETITYGELREELALPYLVQGMGRLLDLLSEDCSRRNEPSLASIVVNASTGEVGDDFDGDARAERQLVFSQKNWS